MLGKCPNTILQLGLALLPWAICGASQKDAPPQPAAQFTRADSSVLTAMLLDIVGPRSKTARDIVLVLSDKTTNKTGNIEDDALKYDTGGKETPPDVRADLRRRNTGKVVALSGFRPNPRDVRVAEVYRIDREGNSSAIREEAFEEQFPTARYYIVIWLPGYSRDGRQAVIRYYSNENPRGRIGTYLLQKQERGWKVVWRALK